MPLRQANRFERHAGKTAAVLLVGCILVADIAAANLYRWVKGYPLAQRDISQFLLAQNAERQYRESSDVYHHGLAKMKAVDDARWGGRVYPVRTNSLGFKDSSARDVALTSDQYRIVFIGDSFTEGNGVAYEQTFVGLIDEALSKKNIEVLNAGVGSYSPVIYWRKVKHLIEEVGLRFDELVVYLDVSDVQDEATKYRLDGDERVVLKGDSVQVVEAPGSTERIKEWVRRNTILTFSALNAVHDVFNPPDVGQAIQASPRVRYAIDWDRSRWSVDDGLFQRYGRAGLQSMTRYMDKLRGLLQEHGIKLTVAVYPWPDQVVYDTVDSIHVQHWKRWCAQQDVAFVDYFPHFLKGSTRQEKLAVLDQYFIQGDVHWNEAGHRLIAEVFLARYTGGAWTLAR